MKVKRFNQYLNALSFIRYKFPKYMYNVENLIVLELNNDEWETMSLSGTGYMIREDSVNHIQNEISRYSPKELKMWRELYDYINRDLWIYDLYLTKARSLPFIIVRGSQDAFLIHEAAHEIWISLGKEQKNIKLPELTTVDNDKYMESESERFTHMIEMEYFKAQNINFDNYFQMTNPDNVKILNDSNASEKLRQLALLDYMDLKKIWEQI